MIVVQLCGGLGNQMFQYAIGRALSIKHKTILKFDTSLLDNHLLLGDTVTPRNLEIDVFDNIEIIPFIENSVFLSNIYYQKIKYKLTIKYLLQKTNLDYIREQEHDIDFLKNILDNVYLVGFFQTEIFFKDIRPILIKDFGFPLTDSLVKLKQKIKQSQSISLHVRRGDYMLEHNHKAHTILNKDYYTKAIQFFVDMLKSPTFFVFSDDINWAKKNIYRDGVDFQYISGNPSLVDMELMHLCKHNIIANSSFSWWGAWLNTNEDKQVICPVNWEIKHLKLKKAAKGWIMQ